MENPRCDDHQRQIHTMEIKLTKIETTVDHIKDRIDNGLSGTVTKIWDRLNDFRPAIEDSKFWVGKIKWAVFWIAIVAVGGGLARVFMNIIG